jgi:ubiquinol-cytochrome c reductase cytochrome b subunit
VVSDATLNRFFALHVIALPLVLVGLVAAHIIALHEVGSNNPDGVDIKKNKGEDGVPLDGIPFHPYYTVKDIVGVVVFLMLFSVVVFFIPEMGGYFLEHANFIPADPLKTPEHIAPVWYFTPFYTVLRAVPDPFLGVVAMGAAVVILFFMPWLDRSEVRSWRYRGFLHKANIIFFAISFIILGYLGVKPPEPFLAEMGLRFSQVYFLFFAVLWFLSKPRSTIVSVVTFVVSMGLITLYDLARYSGLGEEAKAFVQPSWLIPGIYMAAMTLLPIFTRLNVEKPVPERVTYS